jgi:hypothetical protein
VSLTRDKFSTARHEAGCGAFFAGIKVIYFDRQGPETTHIRSVCKSHRRLGRPYLHDRDTIPVMATLPSLILFLWAISSMVQFSVLFLVIAKRHFRALPIFTAYIALNLCQVAFLLFVYSHFGFTSDAAWQASWLSELVILAVQALAATELLHHVLRPYAGIWALAWRLIAAAAVIVISYAAASAQQRPDWILLTANRGYHLTFAVALVSCLLLVRFYSIPVDPVYKMLLGGFCVFSCAVVAANTLLQILFLRRFPESGEIWNYLEIVVFTGVQIAWAVALRHPVRVENKPTLLPPSSYDRISPEVNSRLRALNDVLSKFFRWQGLRP